MQYQNLRNAYLNQEKWIFQGVGELGIPPLPAVDVPLLDSKFIRFDMALKDKNPEDKIVHFFTDDFLFDRVWHQPERYLQMLGRFRAVIAPDFSMYTDHPRICQMFNHFRKHWCGAYWTGMGITVIPSPSWVMGSQEDFSWCLDGEPMRSTICISSHGAIKGDIRKAQFLAGWNEVIRRLEPERIFLFGDTFPGLEFPGGELVHVTNEVMQAKRRYCKRGQR